MCHAVVVVVVVSFLFLCQFKTMNDSLLHCSLTSTSCSSPPSSSSSCSSSDANLPDAYCVCSLATVDCYALVFSSFSHSKPKTYREREREEGRSHQTTTLSSSPIDSKSDSLEAQFISLLTTVNDDYSSSMCSSVRWMGFNEERERKGSSSPDSSRT